LDFLYRRKIKNVTDLYVSEMETIAKIKDEKLMRLAFATLILHKHCGQFSVNGVEKYHPSVRNCDADIYRVAELNDVSGTKKNKMWKQLADMGLVKFYVKTNTAFKFNPEWIAMTLFTVPFNVDLKEDKTGEEIITLAILLFLYICLTVH